MLEVFCSFFALKTEVFFLEAVKSRGQTCQVVDLAYLFWWIVERITHHLDKVVRIWPVWSSTLRRPPFPQVERILEDDGCPQRALSEQNSLHGQSACHSLRQCRLLGSTWH